MWALVLRLWNGLRTLLGLILPIFARAGEVRRFAPVLRWVLHFLLVAGILVGLYFLNQALGIAKHVPGIMELGKFWLPILFLLIYLLGWLGWWLWKLLITEDEVSHFPDIDEAWSEAIQALHEAGIGLGDAPIYLVLGQPAAGEEALFEAARFEWKVKQAPKRPNAPLHVYSDGGAIFVTCAGASVLGRLAEVLATEGGAEGNFEDNGQDEAAAINVYESIGAMVMKGRMAKVREILARAEQKKGANVSLSDVDEDQLQRILKVERRASAAEGERRPRAVNLLRNTAEVEELCARLRHLCRLIGRDRRPLCPVNGILLLVPYAATDNDRDAQDTGLVCRGDLVQVRQALQLRCPVFVLVCDMERATGFTDFSRRFSEDERLRRLGQRFPLGFNPQAAGITLPELIDSGVRWICHSVFPTWIYDLLRLESPERGNFADVVKKNGQLFWLANEMHVRQKRLSHVLKDAMVPESEEPLWFGGCYLAGTGKNPAREQAFVAGVFRRLSDEQSVVAWTDEAVADDARYHRWSRIGWATLSVATLLIVAAAVMLWRSR